MKCDECEKRTYVYRNKKFKNIKIYYCDKCKKIKIAHNGVLI